MNQPLGGESSIVYRLYTSRINRFQGISSLQFQTNHFDRDFHMPVKFGICTKTIKHNNKSYKVQNYLPNSIAKKKGKAGKKYNSDNITQHDSSHSSCSILCQHRRAPRSQGNSVATQNTYPDQSYLCIFFDKVKPMYAYT